MLKCACEITNGDEQQHYYIYHMNNHIFSKKMKYWNKIYGTNREILYGMENHNHDSRFCDVEDLISQLPDIFQSDYDEVNHHLHVCYNFDNNEKYINIIFLT